MNETVEEIVKKCYLEILDRLPDKSGFDNFVTKMKKGEVTESELKSIMQNSSEYKTREKTKNFLKYAPNFSTNFDDETIKQHVNSVPEWYHSIKLGNTVIHGRHTLDYQLWLGQAIPLELYSKSVLDIGAWDGFFSFLCEKRGASRVLAIDSYQHDTDKTNALSAKGFEICKKILNSKVEFQKKDLYNLEQIPESFDIVLLYGVHYHLHDIVGAFQKIYDKVNESLLVGGWVINHSDSMMYLYEPFEMNPADSTNWWVPTISCLQKISKRAGFSKFELIDTLDLKDISNNPPTKINENIIMATMKISK